MEALTGLFETATGRLAVFHRGRRLSWIDCEEAQRQDAMDLFWRAFFQHHKPSPQMLADLMTAPDLVETKPGVFALNLLAAASRKELIRTLERYATSVRGGGTLG